MEISFLYPASSRSPHQVHLTWAKSLGAKVIETPMGIGFFDTKQIESSELLLLESLYCAPFARRYKRRNPACKVLSIIADTSFWSERLCVFRKIYYWRYLPAVDGFIAVSERIKRDIQSYVKKPVEVVRPFLINKFRPRKRSFEKKILFIGNEAREKGYLNLVRSMEYLPDFELFLVGDCCRKVRSKRLNVRLEGRVTSLKPYFERCSIYTHPADFDPCPVVVWEAMYAGLIPVITEDVGQSELFKGSLRKLVLKSNDPKSIANKILEVYSAPDRRELIKKCMRLSENHTEEKSIKRFKRSFYQLLRELD